ncbi:MAG: YlcI/YnfO family protein, partial [Nocardioides sp.]|uniref:YlcI/YnfO family protein n=1 Tax=Nocardioides sp. TaxID=35761 RepID=UPI0039E45C15
AGGPEIAEAADRLGAALDPAARLGLMEALSDAAAELSAALPDTTVRVVLDGRRLDFAVDYDEPLVPEPAAAAQAEAEDDGDDSVARLTLRLPESVKTRAEELAARTGVSLNSWVVNALRSATSDEGISVEFPFQPGLGAFGGPRGRGFGGPQRGGQRPGSRRETGWI